MGHVSAGPVRLVREGGDLQGRQRGGATGEGALAISAGSGSVDRRIYGADGEDQAARWYQDRGYEIIDRNWRCRAGELDLVVQNGSTLVFCEVKARRTDRFGAPFEAVTRTKQARIRKLAAQWLRERGASLQKRPPGIRFDVAAVSGENVDVIEEAF